MTVATTTSRIAYTGNGATTSFSFPYPFFADSNLTVYVDGVLKTLTTDYSVPAAAPYPTGANVLFVAAPSNGSSIVIARVVPYTQSLDLVENDPLPAEDVEEAFDSGVMMTQQLLEILGRAITIPVTDTAGTTVALPNAAARALQSLIFDASGNITVGLPSNATVNAIMQSFVASTSLSLARTRLGVPYTPWRNKFRNSSFDTFSRGTFGTITAGVPAYSHDGWIISCTGANITFGVGGPGFSSDGCIVLTGLAGCTQSSIKQRIAGDMLVGSVVNGTGLAITVQFRIYNATGGTIIPTLTAKSPTVKDNYGAVNTIVSGVAVQSCPINQFTLVAYTLPAVNYMDKGLEVTLDFGAALNSNTKSIYISDPDCSITPGYSNGIQTIPYDADLRPGDIEKSLNEAFYEKSFAAATAPAQSVGNNSGEAQMVAGKAGAASDYIPVRYRTRKFSASPTITLYNPANANAQIRDQTAGGDCSATAVAQSTDAGFTVSATGNAGTAVGNLLGIHWTSSSEL